MQDKKIDPPVASELLAAQVLHLSQLTPESMVGRRICQLWDVVGDDGKPYWKWYYGTIANTPPRNSVRVEPLPKKTTAGWSFNVLWDPEEEGEEAVHDTLTKQTDFNYALKWLVFGA
eukprot:jgi/Mesvir1/29056/Mv18364-RA.1